jgi:phosphate transport system permease protein
VGDVTLYALCAAAALATALTLFEIGYQVVHGASLSISHYGLPFIWHGTWAPNLEVFGAGTMLFGTLVSSAMAMVLAVPLGIAIAIYLALLAPPAVRAVVGPLVEMLAAIPSVILGFWGLIVLVPFVQKHVEPALHSALGWIPIFGPQQTVGLSIFTAGLVLTVMVLPIVASLSRDLFLTVPRELREGAEALGATRWEVIRGVILPTTASGVAAACVLGLGRALGEAIAVSLVVGGGNSIHASLFEPGSTIASRIANDFTAIVSSLHQSSLFYLATILFAITAATSLLARVIARRFDVNRVRTT